MDQVQYSLIKKFMSVIFTTFLNKLKNIQKLLISTSYSDRL